MVSFADEHEEKHIHYKFPLTEYSTLEEWERKRAKIRERILFSAGLMPFPKKDELNVKIFDKVEFDDFTVEKVTFTSLPGFEVTGNLYKPRFLAGKVPAILNPHGHWLGGRLDYANRKQAYEAPDSVQEPVRNANFAKMGFVSFSYDMVGYVDSRQLDHQFEGELHALWGISLLGLQLWNSIRALDFVSSLPEVDSNNIGCTGASGGATQAMLLGAVDDRLKLLAPVNMISAHMQGGCRCENAPNLRIVTNNVEIASVFAPKPMLVTGCSGDWTCNLETVEFPAIRNIYRLYGAEDRVGSFFDDAPHNYNKKTREAVYRFFRSHFLGKDDWWHEQPVDFGEDCSMLRIYPIRMESEKKDERYAMCLFAQLKEEKAAFLAEVIDKIKSTIEGHGKISQEDSEGETNRLFKRLEHVFELDTDLDKDLDSLGKKDVQASGSAAIIVRLKDAGSAEGDQRLEALLQDRRANFQEMFTYTIAAGDSFRPFGADRSLAAHYHTYNMSKPVRAVHEFLQFYRTVRQKAFSSIEVFGFGEAGLVVLAALPFVGDLDRAYLHVHEFDFNDDTHYIDRFFVPHFCSAGGFNASLLFAPSHRVELIR
ncbi:alpha/beta hydrolase [Paenibacillus contaminans]|uniref:Uncharacterized protein n=1 Tax=Paenibacillus contaminans TaxID=450362 RepID=A0A329N0A9_9BACL|nr:acetylxylan esterase [Paenibacillus contaminans]RAV23097.1 hypothetical protein DQG23_02570 [Paenibacillus contaminans]